jgi:hypothetical protein
VHRESYDVCPCDAEPTPADPRPDPRKGSVREWRENMREVREASADVKRLERELSAAKAALAALPIFYTAASSLDPTGQPYTWAELVELAEHHSLGELRELNDGRVVSASWDPNYDPDPEVLATRRSSK